MGNLYDRLGLWVVPGSAGERLPEVRDWILLRWAIENMLKKPDWVHFKARNKQNREVCKRIEKVEFRAVDAEAFIPQPSE